MRADNDNRPGYEFIEHTADIAIRAYGRTIEEAFGTAAEALFDIITDDSQIEAKEKIAFGVESVDTEGLLVGFLSQLIVLHEVERYVLTDFSVTFSGDGTLDVVARGEKFDPSRHRHGHQVKGVSYHLMEIGKSEGDPLYHVQVLFDV